MWVDRQPLSILHPAAQRPDCRTASPEQLSRRSQILRLPRSRRRFDFRLLQALTEHTETALVRLMKELIGAQLVVEDVGRSVCFCHALTQQAVATNGWRASWRFTGDCRGDGAPLPGHRRRITPICLNISMPPFKAGFKFLTLPDWEFPAHLFACRSFLCGWRRCGPPRGPHRPPPPARSPTRPAPPPAGRETLPPAVSPAADNSARGY
jgi:hypothetical protein